jgi:hypothetical protein
VIISIVLSFLSNFPAIVLYGPTKVSPIGFNVNGTACNYEDHYVGSNGLANYHAVFMMLTCVSFIITICVLYAMVAKKIYKQRKMFTKNNPRSD